MEIKFLFYGISRAIEEPIGNQVQGSKAVKVRDSNSLPSEMPDDALASSKLVKGDDRSTIRNAGLLLFPQISFPAFHGCISITCTLEGCSLKPFESPFTFLTDI